MWPYKDQISTETSGSGSVVKLLSRYWKVMSSNPAQTGRIKPKMLK
jgi:hypothetical protein